MGDTPVPSAEDCTGPPQFSRRPHIGDDWRLTPLLEVAMNERIRRLREESFNAKPSFSAERALRPRSSTRPGTAASPCPCSGR